MSGMPGFAACWVWAAVPADVTTGIDVVTTDGSENSKFITVKPVLNVNSTIDKTKILMTNGSLMKVESIAECYPWSILQYFWPALSNYRYWKPILVSFLSGRLRQVLQSHEFHKSSKLV